jgi:hypothetical protein
MAMKKYFNIGCGFTVDSQFENFDASPTLRLERLPIVGALVKKNGQRFPDQVKYGDITKGPLCPPGFASGIFCSHMLEHVPHEDMQNALANMYVMLGSGGVLRVIVPDLWSRARLYVEAYQSGSAAAADGFMATSGLGRPSRGGLKGRLIDSLGNSAHLWMYDSHSMKSELERAGFRTLRQCRFGDSAVAAFAGVERNDRFVCDGLPEVAFECVK